MRFPAAVVPAILLLAGAVYFFAKAKDSTPPATAASPFAQPALAGDPVADESDRVLVLQLLEIRDLNEAQSNSLVRAAGRRYMRRKLAFAAAQQAAATNHAALADREPLRREMETARKVCDVA